MADPRLTLLLILTALLGLVLGGLLTGCAPEPRIVRYRQVGPHALHLHVFEAQGERPARGAPALLFFHGGGWALGQPGQFHPQCRHFARRGFSCISVEYRLASRHGTDARDAMDDAAAALAYVRSHAAALGIDPARIIAGGGSAGGHLAATLGLGMAQPQAPRPAALVLYNPMLDLAPGRPDHEPVAGFWRQVSPMHHVDAQLPPTLILSGRDDAQVPVATLERFCQAARDRGGRCELALYAGADHGFFNPRDSDRHHFEATNARIEAFLSALAAPR
jgi:acetyl esterase/lipase